MTAATDRERNERTRDVLFGSLSNTDARVVLGRLVEADPVPVAIDELAERVAAVKDAAPGEPRRSSVDRAHLTLRHHVLPMLADADLVEIDAEGAVATTDHPALSTASIVDLLTDPDRVAAGSLDDAFDALARSRRRYVLTRLHRSTGPDTAESLAREIAASEAGVDPEDVSRDRVERVEVSLRHQHLPLLADLGFVVYEERTGTVAVGSVPEPIVRWIESETADDERDVGARPSVIVERVVGRADQLAHLVR